MKKYEMCLILSFFGVCTKLRCSIMIAARNNINRIVIDFIHQPVFAVDAARPETGKPIFQGFRLTQAAIRSLYDVFQKLPELFRGFWRALFKIALIFEGLRRKNYPHKSSSLTSMPFPDSSSAMDLRKCSELAELPKR